MLDIELIKCCIYQLDCFRIEYDASKLKFYQENWEPDEEERQQQVNARVIIWLDGQKSGEPGRYADFAACNYYIADWQLYSRDDEGNVRELLDSSDYNNFDDTNLSDWDDRYDD